MKQKILFYSVMALFALGGWLFIRAGTLLPDHPTFGSFGEALVIAAVLTALPEFQRKASENLL